MASCAPRTSSALSPETTAASSSSTTRAAAAAPYVQPIPVSPPASTSTRTSVVSSHSSVPSDSCASVGTVKTEARSSVSGVSTRSATAATACLASRLERVEHLPDRLSDHPAARGISVQNRLREVLGLLEGDVRRQRRHLRIRDRLEHRRPVGGKHLVPRVRHLVGIVDPHALEP